MDQDDAKRAHGSRDLRTEANPIRLHFPHAAPNVTLLRRHPTVSSD